MQDRYAVVGNPIAHSKSPAIHTLFAKQTQQKLSYEKILIELGHFEKDVKRFFTSGGKGLNVTVPFKENAFTFPDQLTPRAQLAGAVNTLIQQTDGSILGDTTDGAGLINDLQRNCFLLKNAKILVLGAGGAVRGILEPLLAQQPKEVVIANRTVAKAQMLADIFDNYGNIRACGFDDLTGYEFDTVINGTSASLAGELPPVPESIFANNKNTGAYDMMYSKKLTPFLLWAKQQNVSLLTDGLGMLVGQAAESFQLWRGVMPDITPVIDALRNQ
ncbi:shikimate dehydrogenase [Marinagarivorans cellulosilyticus]|uniref:Shikimate dehydrogenase (NADP(+)) n=1 Tax=Marinagarivorans cellulosilyticus TaxID=2721545 RepID=A0AAN1WG72_9GAMM|nr:shikimate dehydrogenase [Marinagarivorans cellulosilyticus]BCD96988.1 shikimate dehydrogenase [Marinagarivorans cellulosilyticus]